jgi:hypothetical protein
MNQQSRTPFEEQAIGIIEGRIKAPSVHFEGKEIPFTFYQINVHLSQLSLMAKGIKFRGMQLRHFKDFYGLKGRSAKACKEELTKLKEHYGY